MSDFETIAGYFDAYIEWDRRLKFEMPFLLAELERAGTKSVLDVGCGSGRHAIEIAHAGYEVTGIDRSPRLLGTARELASDAGADVEFLEACIEELGCGPGHLQAPGGPLEGREFDACLMLGNTVAFLGDDRKLAELLELVREALAPGGMLITQMPNYWDRIRRRDPSTRFRKATIDGKPCMLIKTLTYSEKPKAVPDVIIHLLKISQEGDEFKLEDNSTPIRALAYDELKKLFDMAGFVDIRFHGSMDGREFDRESSPDCIAVAYRPG